MNNNDYLIPGLCAIILAILFPLFWISQIFIGAFDFSENAYNSISSFDFSDWAFLALGLLGIYIYLSLKRVLNDQANFRELDLLLHMMIAISLIFYLGLFALEATTFFVGDKFGLSTHKAMLNSNYVISIACMIIFGVIDILIGIVLLRSSQQLPDLLKLFAVVTLIQGFFELTLIFSFSLVAIYPISLIILAIYFLRKPDMIEVV